MKPYLLSLAAGVLVGIIYGLINIRSPAPPVIALVGLLGILAGEQIPFVAHLLWQKESLAVSWLHQVHPHMFGKLPGGEVAPQQTKKQFANDSSGPSTQ